MATDKIFSMRLVESDAFADLPLTAQALYFHLALNSDDECFVLNPRQIQRSVGASEDDLKQLMTENFAFPVDGGVMMLGVYHRRRIVES